MLQKSLLIAAVIASLFAAMCAGAYALNLFGLRDFLVPGTKTVTGSGLVSADVSYLSMAGAQGTPEYKAAEEWINWHWDYTGSQPKGWIDDDWEPSDQNLKDSSKFYACYDDTMAVKLLEISEKYGLKLHTLSTTPLDLDDLYKLAGTADFVLADDVHVFPKYIYEDGSFSADGEDFTGKSFGLIRSIAGTLPPAEMHILNADDSHEWSYINLCGNIVSIAVTPSVSGELSGFILYSEGDATIVLGTQQTDKAQIEALADCFDFSAACGGEPSVVNMVNAPPRATAAPKAATLEAFAQSPEYKGLREFIDFRRLQGRLLPCYYGVFPVSEDSAYAQYSEEDKAIADAMEARAYDICQTHGLKAHTGFTESQSYGEACELTGAGDFILDGEDGFFRMRVYEDGSFNMNFGLFYYVKKGSLCLGAHPSRQRLRPLYTGGRRRQLRFHAAPLIKPEETA